MLATLTPCPRTWQDRNGADHPCPAYLDMNAQTREMFCPDHGLVGKAVMK